jgi:hypothetical protein
MRPSILFFVLCRGGPAAAGQLPDRLTAEFRRNGNLEWDLPTDVIWRDERECMSFLAPLSVTWPLDGSQHVVRLRSLTVTMMSARKA